MEKLFNNKRAGLALLVLIYVLAAFLGIVLFIVFEKLELNILINILICDAIATVVVWLFGVILKSASIYDPYWSVQTAVIYTALLIKFNAWNLGSILFLSALLFWAIRLTVNFAVGFGNLRYIDWRYKMLKEKTGVFYQLVNLLGICMFPTMVVYLASVPFFIYAIDGYDFNPIQIIGLIIMVGATLLELVSDIHMKQFIKTRKDRSEIINVGLWKYSRHPNYLGEISFWFGALFVLLFTNFNMWYWSFGAIINLIMFLVISIPMEENHIKEYKPGFMEYKKTTSMLLILPRRKPQDSIN